MATNVTLGCSTDDMYVIHRLLRRLFTDAPPLVREVPDGDVARTAVVADHVDEISGTLHHHHQTEDELLWDVLESRSPACSLHVGRMRSQHATVAELIGELGAAVPAWRRTASREDRERVAGLLDSILAALEAHLGDEEQKILPVASESMSQAEWDRLGEHARASIPRDRRLIQLGMLLESFDSAEERRAWVRANLPIPVRLLFSVVGRRQFEAHRRALHGTRA